MDIKKISKNKIGKQGIVLGAVIGVIAGVAFLPENMKDQINGLVGKLTGGVQ